MSKITYQVEKLADCLEEMKPFLQLHWEEVALYKDAIKLNPDYDRYFDLEKRGVLRVAIARDGDKMVGYFLTLTQEHLHYQDHIPFLYFQF